SRRRAPAAHDLLPRPGRVPVLDDVPHPPRLPRLGARGARGGGDAQPHRGSRGRRRGCARRPPAHARREAEELMRVAVVGTGIAGLITAYRASERHDVVLVTKAELAESNTKYAQGGIAAALFPDDSAAAHIDDTLVAGAGLCDRAAVEVLCTEGPQRVRDLIALGVAFDRDASGELERGHEAAHSARRVIHAGGDATGLAIEVALLRAVRELAVEVHAHTFMRDLVVRDGRVVGIDAVTSTGAPLRIDADVVVLA